MVLIRSRYFSTFEWTPRVYASIWARTSACSGGEQGSPCVQWLSSGRWHGPTTLAVASQLPLSAADGMCWALELSPMRSKLLFLAAQTFELWEASFCSGTLSPWERGIIIANIMENLCTRYHSRHSPPVDSFHPHNTWDRQCYCSYCIDEETEVQRGLII